MDSSPRDLHLIERIHKGQARIHRRRQALVEAIAKLPLGVETPPGLQQAMARLESMEAANARTDAFLAKCTTTMVTAKAAIAQEFAGITDEQLQAQLTAEFLASIKTWGPDQWEVVEEHQRKTRSKE